MSMMKCPECGKDISSQAENCPNCGFPTNPHKGATKIAIGVIAAICGIIAIFIIFSAISDLLESKDPVTYTENSNEKTNTLVGAYYVGTEDSHVYVVRFNDDNLIEIVDAGLGRDADKRSKFYGTYESDGSSLTIHLSGGADWNCALHEDSNAITIEGVEFVAREKSDLSEETLDCFD